jgi:hypothetical protein
MAETLANGESRVTSRLLRVGMLVDVALQNKKQLCVEKRRKKEEGRSHSS